jgi:Methyltransferase domain
VKRVNLGCGLDVRPGWENVDLFPVRPGVKRVDLDWLWPWADGEVDEFRAIDVFEHVTLPVHFMTEAHRCLRPGGRLHIQTNNWRHWTAYADPTHRRYCDMTTFDFWIPGTEFYQQNPMYGGVSFDRVSVGLTATQQIEAVLLRA